MTKLFIPRKDKFDPQDSLTNFLSIERWANSLSLGTGPVFDFPGPLFISTTDFHTLIFPTNLTTFYARLIVASSFGSVSAIVQQNGQTMGTVTLSSSTTLAGPFNIPIGGVPGDGLQATLTSIGTGAVGLSICGG